MSNELFLGLLVSSLAVLIGIASGLTTLIIKPYNKLTRAITHLTDRLEEISREHAVLKTRVDIHGKEINAVTEQVIRHDADINNLKKGGSV